MKKIIRLMCFGIIVLVAMACVVTDAKAATTTIVFESDNYKVNNGDEITIKIYLSSDSDIGAYHTEVVYDKYRLQYVGGGDYEKDGHIILEGTGYGNTVVYKFVFKAISGGMAEISCANTDIRVEGSGEASKQDVAYSGGVKIDIDGEDTAIRDYNVDKYGIDTDIPIAGVVDGVDSQNYYIVDHSRYIPEIVDFEYKTVSDVYDSVRYTFISNVDNEVKLVYMIDKEGDFAIYSYSKSKKAFYPCEIIEDNGAKYYIMSANSCDSWADELTLDYVKKENICYAMTSDGECGFYKYADGSLTLWTEDEGKAFLDKQMALFYWILIVAVVVMSVVIALIIISGHKKQKRRNNRRNKNFKISDDSKFEIEFIDVESGEAQENAEVKEKKSKPVIAIKDVTMKFGISTSNVSGIKELVINKLKGMETHRDFVALDHVSMNIYKGEVLGLIGTNGSGKSTLLKLVSGAMTPTSGKINVDRDKVQLLSLGTGFDRELTARENIYLSGAIIGYTKEFIDDNFDKIIEFAELEDFVEEKVKNFSSGMVSRLAFSIATIGEAAEILILDEILSVGDEFFRKKSLKRVKEIIHGGSTVIMVAHSMSTILENCTKVVWLEKGKVIMIGEPKVVCKAYRKYSK